MTTPLVCLAILHLAWLLGCSAVAGMSMWFGVGHALLSCAAAWQCRRHAHWRRPGGTMLWIAATLGPVGMIAGRCVQPLFARLPLRLHLPAPEGHDDDDVEPVATRLTLPPDPSLIGAMAPVFRHGRIADRQAAIEAAVLSYQPRLSAIVAMGLTDTDQTIRALAASASTRAGQLLVDRRRRLERAIEAQDRLDDRIALATMLANHGEHDTLLSPARRARLRAEAAAMLGQVLPRLGADDPRRDMLLTLRHRVAPGEAGADALPLAAALDRLYRARDFAGLAARCRQADAMALAEHDPLHAMAAWWRRHDEAGVAA